MVKKMGLLVLASVVTLALLIGGWGCAKEAPAPKPSPAPAPPAKVVQVRIHSQMPVGNYVTEGVDLFIKEAEARSNNTLKFSHFPAEQLFKIPQAAEVLPTGGVEMAQISPTAFVGKAPESFIASCPTFTGSDWWVRWFYGSKGAGGYFYKHLRPALAKINVHLIGNICYDPNGFYILTKKQIKTGEDYKGLKIRASGSPYAAMLEGFGITPVVMSAGDVYMALETGVLDGGFSGPATFVDRKWYEVGKHCQINDNGSVFFGLAANMDFWKGLTSQQQKAITEASKVADIWTLEAATKEHNTTLATFKQKGGNVYEFPPAEWEKLKQAGARKVDEVMRRDMGPVLTDAIYKMIQDTKDDKTTAQEIIKSRPD